VGVGGRWEGPGGCGPCGARGLGVNGELMGVLFAYKYSANCWGNVSVRSCTYRFSVTIEVQVPALPWLQANERNICGTYR
jgi:hypothetical protein